jgi:membrane fusion protein, heavy metal efflux system
VKRFHIAALISSLWLCSCSSKPASKAGGQPVITEPKSVQVDAAVGRDLGITVAKAEEMPVGTPVAATGQLQINEDSSWIVGAVTDGKIISVPARVGDSIRQGQVLAVLHSHDVHDARATYRQAVAQLAREKAMAEQARTVRDRTRRLFDLRAASREQLDAAETMYLSATNTVATVQADVDKARFHLTDFLEVSAESHDDHGDSARDGLSIKSPASGTVMERKATVGTVVSAGDPVFTIADLSSLWLIASVNEADMSRVKPGQRVQIVIRAFADRKFPGRVMRLGERLDPQTRTLQVRVLVPNAGGLMMPDMFATAEFETGETRPAVQIPESAVQEMNGKAVVFVRRESGSFDAREVRVGQRTGDRVEVLAGLRAGDSVVVNGAFLLKTELKKVSGD